MKNINIDVRLRNKSLRDEFARRKLDLSQVFYPDPDDLHCENRLLELLLDWVQKYSECGSRQEMQIQGYHYPPIEPGFCPDEDWRRFELWFRGKTIRGRLKDRLPSGFTPIASESLTDDELLMELTKLVILLEKIRVVVDCVVDVPPRLVYEFLLEALEEELDYIETGYWHLDGCSGYCPGCFQRPWCAAGNSSCWQEDEEAKGMVLIDSVKEFVSPSPVSLQVLRTLQADGDRELEEFRKSCVMPFDFDDLD